MQNRPPIVVVMGHIDHGKTTLLDYVRKSNVAARESGGITQHIGAYEAEFNGKKITFIDTPGHEAFSKMRGRGAKVADIAILVVAADDGVKPQTKEALAAIKTAKIPFLVAINKIDKPNANIERIKNELAEAEVFLEGRGGNVPYAEISAKAGTNVPHVLETLLLMAEMENLKSDESLPASGVIIESHLDSRRGITATLLVREGALKKGEFISAGGAVSKVRIFENFAKKSITLAGPSSPAVVVGFDRLPQVGAEFRAFKSQKEAEAAARLEKPPGSSKPGFETSQKPGFFPPDGFSGKPQLGIVIKTDVAGSVDAILHEMNKLKNDNIDVKILRAEAGDISEDDVKLASSAPNSLILGFKVSLAGEVRDLGERLGVTMAIFEIIYEIPDFIKGKIAKLAPPVLEKTIVGRAKILKIFSAKGGKNQVIGGRVSEGALKRGAGFYVLRRGNKIGEGKFENLQSGRVDAPEVAGGEFGALISSKIAVLAGDELENFE